MNVYPDHYDMSEDEFPDMLGAEEQRLLDDLNARPLIPFRVTASSANHPVEQLSILARSSCDAAVQAIQLLFFDAGDCSITTGFKIKVEPIRAQGAGKDAGLLYAEEPPCAA